MHLSYSLKFVVTIRNRTMAYLSKSLSFDSICENFVEDSRFMVQYS
jgi:hypothetical protein